MVLHENFSQLVHFTIPEPHPAREAHTGGYLGGVEYSGSLLDSNTVPQCATALRFGFFAGQAEGLPAPHWVLLANRSKEDSG